MKLKENEQELYKAMNGLSRALLLLRRNLGNENKYYNDLHTAAVIASTAYNKYLEQKTSKYAIKRVLELMDEAENDCSVDLDGSNGEYFNTIKEVLEEVTDL